MPIRPVPLVLLAYTPLVLLRLVLALRRSLTPVVLAVSVVVDVLMISVLLWSFHIQYQEDLGLTLKAPTAFYLFVFVALRSLRYDRRYVLLAGATAALAWIALTTLAIRDGSGVTRDFVTYMTSTQVLVGAQVDRIIAILVMTAVLAVGVSRAGTLLERSATESRARTELARYFSPEIVTTILESSHRFRPGEGTVREAAILSVDLRGFTRWAQGVEPDVVMSTLARYQEHVLGVVVRHRGTVDKFMGDGVLCHFGASSEAPASTADALRCAEELREVLRAWQRDRLAS
ncbi:MAG: adenylate/guanylate cyclase domain-containing protein, partial [Spirochaetota bacterium]